MTHSKTTKLFLLAGLGVFGCMLVPVSTTAPPSDANILFWEDEVQSETDVAVAEFSGHVHNAITHYNDFSIGLVNGTVEWSPGLDPFKRNIEQGFSLQRFALKLITLDTHNGKTSRSSLAA